MLDQQQTVGKFVKVASSYCSFLEDHCAYSTKQFIRQCDEYLSAITAALSDFPDRTSDSAVKSDMPITTWIARNIADKLEAQDSYSSGGDAGIARFSDDLTKIYQALKVGLQVYSSDPVEAVSYWKASFSPDHGVDLQRTRISLTEIL